MKRSFLSFFLPLCALMAMAQTPNGIALSSSAPLYQQNFDCLGGSEITAEQITSAEKTSYSKESTLPPYWKIMGNTTNATTTPSYSKASEAGDHSTYIGGTNMASNAKNGTWNLGKAGDTDRALGGATTGVDGGAKCINVLTVIKNTDTETIHSLDISYDIEKYRKGSNSAGYTFALYYNTTDDSNVWTAAGSDFSTIFTADTETIGAADANLPIDTRSVSGKLVVDIEPGEVLYLLWHCAVTSGTTYNAAQVLALDNVSITANYGTTPGPEPEKLPSIKVNENAATVSENFDSMEYPAADATEIEKGYYGKDYALPTAWRMERNQSAPRTIGAYSDAMLTAQYGGGANLPTNASNGTWNLGMNGSSDRALGGMTTGVANGARTINVMAHLENDGEKDFETVHIAYDIEKYREGSNANKFYVKLFTSPDGKVWTEAGEAFTWLNPIGSGQTGFATVPGFTQHVEANLAYHFAAGTDLYLCWSISTSAGDNCASAPCLAVDNITLAFDSYQLSVSEAGWASLCLPFAAEVPNGATAFRAETVSGDVIALKSIDAIPAGEGVLVRADEGKYLFHSASETPAEIQNLLEGVTTEWTVEGEIYTLAAVNSEGEPIFRKYTPTTLAPNKAYLPSGVLGNAPVQVRFVIDRGQIPTDLTESTKAQDTRKVLINGNLFIVREGMTFDINGQLAK